MATEVGMCSATHESVTMPVGRDETEHGPRQEQIRLQDLLPCSLTKKQTKQKESFTFIAVNNY